MTCASCREPLKAGEEPAPGREPECNSCRNARVKTREGRAAGVVAAMAAFAASDPRPKRRPAHRFFRGGR